jgi:hypothetical protein
MLTSEMRNRTELHFIILEGIEEIFMQCLNGSEPYAALKFSVVRKWLACFSLKAVLKMDSEKTSSGPVLHTISYHFSCVRSLGIMLMRVGLSVCLSLH